MKRFNSWPKSARATGAMHSHVMRANWHHFVMHVQNRNEGDIVQAKFAEFTGAKGYKPAPVVSEKPVREPMPPIKDRPQGKRVVAWRA